VVCTDGTYNLETVVGTMDTSSYAALRHTPTIVARCYLPPEKKGTKTPVVVTYGEADFQFTAQYGIRVCAYDPAPFSFPPFFVDNTPPIQPDSGGANLSDYVIGLKNKGNWRMPDDPGALVIRGWGVSRLIDYFATNPNFDSDKVAVEGHSRYGKSALVAGAYDDRIVVTWRSDAGALGTALARRTYGETLDFVAGTTSEYHWLAGDSMKYAGRLYSDSLFPRRVELLDVDAQSTESLIAPRAIFISNGTDTPPGVGDAWADPRGCFLSGFLASSVWEFLGLGRSRHPLRNAVHHRSHLHTAVRLHAVLEGRGIDWRHSRLRHCSHRRHGWLATAEGRTHASSQLAEFHDVCIKIPERWQSGHCAQPNLHPGA
jgi:hypothetical protein